MGKVIESVLINKQHHTGGLPVNSSVFPLVLNFLPFHHGPWLLYDIPESLTCQSKALVINWSAGFSISITQLVVSVISNSFS